GYVGNAANGQLLYANATLDCTNCHGAMGDGLYKIDPHATVFGQNNKTLENIIAEDMPQLNPASCGAECAADIAAYIRTWAGLEHHHHHH
uniref:Putative lipoprotein n=1 Tax=Teredinibacter turnerae TaxID=2426 RepID=UPI0030131E73